MSENTVEATIEPDLTIPEWFEQQNPPPIMYEEELIPEYSQSITENYLNDPFSQPSFEDYDREVAPVNQATNAAMHEDEPVIAAKKDEDVAEKALPTEENKNEVTNKQATAEKPLKYDEVKARTRVDELKARPLSGKFSAAHIRRINKYIVQDSKEIKGGHYRPDNDINQLRSRRIYGTDTYYSMPYYAGKMNDRKLNEIVKEFGSIDEFRSLEKEAAIDKLSALYSNLEKLGAFEAANNKTARTFVEQVAGQGGYTVDWEKINQFEKERGLKMDTTLELRPEQKSLQSSNSEQVKDPNTKTSVQEYIDKKAEEFSSKLANEVKNENTVSNDRDLGVKTSVQQYIDKKEKEYANDLRTSSVIPPTVEQVNEKVNANQNKAVASARSAYSSASSGSFAQNEAAMNGLVAAKPTPQAAVKANTKTAEVTKARTR